MGKPVQYIVMPAAGLVASDTNPSQLQFFQVLHQTALSDQKVHRLSTEAGMLNVKVVDSIGENKAKLIECAPEDLPALRASHPSTRIVPLVYFQRAVLRYEALVRPAAKAGRARTKTSVRAGSVSLSVQSTTQKPVAKAMLVAFTDFATKTGAQGTTNARGQVSLALAPNTRVERLYVYPQSGDWPTVAENVTLRNGSTLSVPVIDLSYVDCVRYFYKDGGLSDGEGVTVGVIDCGVETKHPDLRVAGGENTVPGEAPTDFGDNGTDGHGTHVAGIIAARGTPPNGIRGVAPGVTLRSFRVFGQGAPNASNYSIAKAIDAGVSQGCDLINMSLGGGQPDALTEEALTAAHNAGIVVLAATGNDSRQPVSFPAAYSMCQAVSAMGRKGTFPTGTEPEGSVDSPYGTDKKNFLASFSNIGPQTDLTGPGVGVISTVPAGFGVMSGTSMATPAETGAAARLLATKAAILQMPRDQNRAAAMIRAIAADCKLLGFGPLDEGKGMIR